jgi:DNA-binding transcriptional LysR family regulator
MDVDVRLLRSFLGLAEELHFRRAAERLNLSQPALTRQIQDLERRVGVPLLDRSPQGVTLTSAGRTLAEELPRLLSDLERVGRLAQGAARGEVGHATISFLGSTITSFVTPLLTRLRIQSPSMTFTLTERVWIDQTAGLEAGTDDLAFVRDLRDPRWQSMDLLAEPVCLVVGDWHPYAAKRRIRPRDLPGLAHETFLTDRRPGSGLQPSWVGTHCAGWPFVPRVSDEVVTTHGILALVAADMGVSLMPASYQTWGPNTLRFVPVAGQTTTVQVAWAPRPGNGITTAILRSVRELAGPAGAL